jgi:EAL domain-containing protein (putative c-di-GMP-specific phosphodiesterase class I)/CheY-like chemotaxis protein
MKAATQGTPPAPARILIIDDDQLMLERHKRVLSREGYEATCATSGEEALLMMAQMEFDAIVSDISMPGMSGTDLLREVRSRDEDIPVILATGAPSLESAVEAVELGALQYLVKPLKVETLRSVVSRAVRCRQEARAIVNAGAFANGPLRGATRAVMEETLDAGIEQLWMAYQPIVRWSTREIYAYEALIRTTAEGIPHPGVFFDLAEHLDRVQEVGRIVRSTVAADIISAPKGVHIFVNLHALDLQDPELFAAGSTLTTKADQVVLEITERTSLDLDSQLREQAAVLRRRGFRLAVDDLGAGYAGLTSLAHLDPEVAKIDMSLVRGIDQNPTRLTLVRSLVDACRQLGLLVVAEGVETTAERDVLAEVGCDLMQGFLFSKPEPPFTEVKWE